MMNLKIKKILYMLSDNSRISSKSISKEVKITQQGVSYQISKLKNTGIIKNFSLVADSAKFGYSNFCVLIRLKKYSRNYIREIIRELQKYKEIIAINILFGNYDIFLKFSTHNSSQFNKILREIINNNSNKLIDYTILTQVVVYHFSRGYLSRRKTIKQAIISGDREIVNLDRMNVEIINKLNENSRKNFSHIANELNTTSKTIILRVKNLERKKVIREYGININHTKIGIKKYLLFISFNFMHSKGENILADFSHKCPNIIELIKTFGRWDAILVIEVLKDEDFREVLNIIKEKFADSIKYYDFLESEETIAWKYLPKLNSN